MKRGAVIGKVLLAVGIAFFLGVAFLFASLLISFTSANAGVYILLLLIAAILLELIAIAAQWGFLKKKAFLIPVCTVAAVCAIVWVSVFGYSFYKACIPVVNEGRSLLRAYRPYAEDSKAVTLDEPSALLLTDDLPVMDGATALYPIYASFAKAVYPKDALVRTETKNGKESTVFPLDYLTCSTTTSAYRKIVNGEADIIFAALPSEEQKQYAEERGVELVYTPIGKEAFVFFVNAKNPIEELSLEDVQRIYSGEITRWDELGVEGLGEIAAFQRDKGSGSQSTLEKLMAGKELMTPPKENVVGDMGGIIEQTADYRNYKNAIGYSFRFYATEMVNNNKIKLLRINGAYPSLETIEDGSYPLASYFYAVTRSDADENVNRLLAWIVGEQGQKIVEAVGYTPCR